MSLSPLTFTDTTHSKHAVEIASTLEFVYDALVVVSGDGLVHEVMNGFAQHPQSARAFELPIAHVPGGSANATCLNILGTKVRSSRGMGVQTECLISR